MELAEGLEEQTPAWTMGVMLSAMRDRGWSFDQAWSSAIQRMRVSPDMEHADAQELTDWKFWLNWAKPRFEWAFCGHTGPPPSLPLLEDAPELVVVSQSAEPLLDVVGAAESDPRMADARSVASH